MISINATLCLQVLHFLVLTFLLNRLMFRPLLKMINDRAQHVEKTKRDTANMELDTKNLVRKCLSMERDARKDAGEERAGLKREANDVAEEILGMTRKEIALVRDEVAKGVEEQVRKAREFVRREAMSLADEITEKIAQRSIED